MLKSVLSLIILMSDSVLLTFPSGKELFDKSIIKQTIKLIFKPCTCSLYWYYF